MDTARHHQSDHRQRLAAWLGLLATLLLYLAPLASQAVARHHSLHAGHQGHHPAPAQPTAPQHSDHAVAHELCGYCTLLGQLSWLAVSAQSLKPAPPTGWTPVLPPPSLVALLAHPAFRPRAPPAP
ncbi:DUF2946 family protein [Zobellella endophytica]|uniref:DUF2946 family protein n=1 Tax=Zobellella endophytica TaxID=2116700 RepID=UPI001304FC24|nr:DUF2946 family protein [Zobellella endophytica]